MDSEGSPLLNEESQKIITDHFGASWIGVTALGMLRMIDMGVVHSLDEALAWGLNQPDQEEHHHFMNLAYTYLKENAELFGLIVETTKGATI